MLIRILWVSMIKNMNFIIIDLTLLELFFHQDLLNDFDLGNYHKKVTVQNFPICGHQVLLHIKHRRWKDMTTNTIHYRDSNLVSSSNK